MKLKVNIHHYVSTAYEKYCKGIGGDDAVFAMEFSRDRVLTTWDSCTPLRLNAWADKQVLQLKQLVLYWYLLAFEGCLEVLTTPSDGFPSMGVFLLSKLKVSSTGLKVHLISISWISTNQKFGLFAVLQCYFAFQHLWNFVQHLILLQSWRFTVPGDGAMPLVFQRHTPNTLQQ